MVANETFLSVIDKHRMQYDLRSEHFVKLFIPYELEIVRKYQNF